MSKRHHQSKAEQINGRANGATPFHFEKVPYGEGESMEQGDIQPQTAVHDSSIQHRAYKIHNERGGPAVDKELALKNRELKKDILIILTALLFMTSFWGCNMIKGAGKDVENAGGSIQRTAEHND